MVSAGVLSFVGLGLEDVSTVKLPRSLVTGPPRAPRMQVGFGLAFDNRLVRVRTN